MIESPYRGLIGPLLAYLDVLQRHDPSRPVLVVLREFVPRHWWENLLHNQTALRLKLRLFTRPQHDRGGRSVPHGPAGLSRPGGAHGTD